MQGDIHRSLRSTVPLLDGIHIGTDNLNFSVLYFIQLP